MFGNIGLIGLGLVGSVMAERLKADRFNVVGFDIEKAKCEQLERLEAVAVNSPAHVADIIDTTTGEPDKTGDGELDNSAVIREIQRRGRE